MSETRVKISSSSYWWASVANAPNVLQPYWLIVLPLDVPDLTASLLLWGPSGQRRRCLWTFLFSNVPTFATSRLQEILSARGGTTWARNGRWILPESARLPRNIQGSFTCRKSTTWDIRLYFLSEGGVLRIFSPWKIRRLRSGLNATTRPPKPLPFPYEQTVSSTMCVTNRAGRKVTGFFLGGGEVHGIPSAKYSAVPFILSKPRGATFVTT